MGPASEPGALKLSIVVTALTGVAGIAAGFMIGSRAIMFDGMYSFVDVMLTFGALAVSKLLMQEPTRRFQFGYWHLEPLIGAVESAILTTVCIYAAINAVQGLTSGGYAVSYGFGLIWAGRHVRFGDGHGRLHGPVGARPGLNPAYGRRPWLDHERVAELGALGGLWHRRGPRRFGLQPLGPLCRPGSAVVHVIGASPHPLEDVVRHHQGCAGVGAARS